MLRILYRLLRHILVQYSWSGSQFNNPSVQKHSHTLIVWEVWCYMLHNHVYMFFQVHATTFFFVYIYVSFSYKKNLQCYSIVCSFYLLFSWSQLYLLYLEKWAAKKYIFLVPFFLILPDPVNATQLFSFLTDPDPHPNCEHLYHEKRIIFGKVSRKKKYIF